MPPWQRARTRDPPPPWLSLGSVRARRVRFRRRRALSALLAEHFAHHTEKVRTGGGVSKQHKPRFPEPSALSECRRQVHAVQSRQTKGVDTLVLMLERWDVENVVEVAARALYRMRVEISCTRRSFIRLSYSWEVYIYTHSHYQLTMLPPPSRGGSAWELDARSTSRRLHPRTTSRRRPPAVWPAVGRCH